MRALANSTLFKPKALRYIEIFDAQTMYFHKVEVIPSTLDRYPEAGGWNQSAAPSIHNDSNAENAYSRLCA